MAINLKKFGGDMNVKQNAENSELDSETFDITGEDFEGSANIDQSFKGTKTRKSWVWAIGLVTAALVAIAGYYFNARLEGETEPMPFERELEDENPALEDNKELPIIDPGEITNDSIN